MRSVVEGTKRPGGERGSRVYWVGGGGGKEW